MLVPLAAAAATVAGCPLFPADFATNQRVDALPVAPDSAAIVRSIGVDGALKADFGSGSREGGPIGIPYDVVGRRAPRSRVRFDYAAESDRVRYPIPRGVHIEGGRNADGDRHALLVDRSRCRLYELFGLRRVAGRWTAGSGASWSAPSCSTCWPAGAGSASSAAACRWTDDLEVAAAQPSELAQLVVVPARVRGAGHEPVRPVVGHDQPVRLHGLGNGPRLRGPVGRDLKA